MFIRRYGMWEGMESGYSFVMATKSGRVTTDANGDAEIVFFTPFINDEYSIALSCIDPGGPPAGAVLAYKYDRLNTGFKVITRRTNAQPVANVEVSWLCTRIMIPPEI